MGQRELSLRLYTALANLPDLQRLSPQPGTEAVEIDELVDMLAALTSMTPDWASGIPSHFFADLALRTLNDDEARPFDVPGGHVGTPADFWRNVFERHEELNPLPWPVEVAPRTHVAGSAEFLLVDHWDALFAIRSCHGDTIGKHPIPGLEPPPFPGNDEARRYLIAAFDKDRFRAGHLFALGALYQDAQQMIRKALSGEEVTLPPHLRAPTRFRLVRRTIVEESCEPPLFQPWILDLVREDPCPFWLCRECGRVFTVPRRGKPPVYCSAACRASGIPSAQRRAAYMRTYRQKKADEELAIARVVLAGVATERRLATLRRRFPDKTRPQLTQLLQRVDTDTKTTADEEGHQ